MLNHHTHPTDPTRDQKTTAFDTSMASPSRHHNFTLRVSHRCIVTVAEFWRSRQRWRWNPFYGFPSFGRHRYRVWVLPPSLDALTWWWPVFVCICVLGCQYYQTLRVLCSASGSDTRAWFNRNGFGHSQWGRVLRHIWTSLATTEWRL